MRGRSTLYCQGYECCQETLILPVHVSAAITKVTTVGLKPRFVGYSLVKPYYEWVNGEQEALKVSDYGEGLVSAARRPDLWIVVLRIGKLQGIGEFSGVGFISTQQMVINSPCLTDTKNWLFQCKRHLLASPKQTALELAIPGQTATGKESSNPFMAGSLPKTIHFCDSLQSDEDSFELIELMILCTNFLTMGRIDDADAEVTFIDETLNDARNKNNKSSNSKRWKMTKKQL
ncbi:hypothetical protein Tco_0869610 [Tanacetum coccineum]